MAKWDAVKRYARHKNPELFGKVTSGMTREQRAPLNKAMTAALAEAEREYDRMPKSERDKWRKNTS